MCIIWGKKKWKEKNYCPCSSNKGVAEYENFLLLLLFDQIKQYLCQNWIIYLRTTKSNLIVFDQTIESRDLLRMRTNELTKFIGINGSIFIDISSVECSTSQIYIPTSWSVITWIIWPLMTAWWCECTWFIWWCKTTTTTTTLSGFEAWKTRTSLLTSKVRWFKWWCWTTNTTTSCINAWSNIRKICIVWWWTCCSCCNKCWWRLK